MLRDLSSEAEMTLSLPGLYFTPHTWSVCSLKVLRHLRSAVSQTFTLRSLDELAKCLPSSEKETHSTQEAWPDSVPTTSECALQLGSVKKFIDCFDSLNLHIVELHVAIIRAGKQHLRVGWEAETAHRHCVSLQSLCHFAGGHIKDGNNAINCPIGNIFTIGTLEMKTEWWLNEVM